VTSRAKYEARLGGGVLVGVGETGLGAYTLPHKERVTIGRSGDTDVPINEPSISREHAAIHFVGEDVFIEDLGSSNGTRVREPAQWSPDLDAKTLAATERQLDHGERVRLVSGSIVMLGAVMLMFQARVQRARPRRLWPYALFEERIDEECAHAERGRHVFAIVHVRVSAATIPTATVDIANRAVNAPRIRGGPLHIAEEVLASTTRPSDMISVDESRGEYHILLSPGTATEASELVDQLEQEFRDVGLHAEVGAASYPRDGRSASMLLARASNRPPTPDGVDLPHQVIVRDPQMIALYQLLERVAATDVTVLLLGETGVGKEVVANHIHRTSPRAGGPLVRINCAALPESLLEGELFGHERGAFTGADKAKPGLFESAVGGTIFLDEVGEISTSTQAKLLRVLEDRTVMRLGARTPTTVDTRVVAATNRDLEQEVHTGTFRQDLYFRLNVFPLEIPPLRERSAEVAALANVFIASMCEQMSRPPLRLSTGAIAALETYAWPGNIRELRNVIHRAVVLCQGEVISEAQLPLERMARTVKTRPRTDQVPILKPPILQAPQPNRRSSRMDIPTSNDLFGVGAKTPPPMPVHEGPTSLRTTVEQLERARILAALDECDGNQTRAAKLLGITRRVLMTRLDRYGIARPRK
jgi:two-component system, NtrC family, response regulator AtoC